MTTLFSDVLVGIDFRPTSEVALRQAVRMAKAVGGRVRASFVIDTTVTIPDGERTDTQRRLEEHLRADATRQWDEIAGRDSSLAAVPFDVEINQRVAGLMHALATHRPRLLVLGAFGTRKPDVGIGTVASALVRHSPTDVLLVRDTQSGPFKRIVVGVDFSDTSKRALQRAAEIASLEKAELHVLHVLQLPWGRVTGLSPLPEFDMGLSQQLESQIREQFDAFVSETMREFPDVKAHARCEGLVGHRSELAAFAKQADADLLVVGTRGRSNVRDLLLGSTAEKMLRETACSVLAVKPATAA